MTLPRLNFLSVFGQDLQGGALKALQPLSSLTTLMLLGQCVWHPRSLDGLEVGNKY